MANEISSDKLMSAQCDADQVQEVNEIYAIALSSIDSNRNGKKKRKQFTPIVSIEDNEFVDVASNLYRIVQNAFKRQKIEIVRVDDMRLSTDALQMQIDDLKAALAAEQDLVQILKAQNDAHFRKEKIQTLKSCERNGKAAKIDNRKNDQKLVMLSAKIDSLTQINKSLVEKIQKLSQTNRQKITDIKQLKESHQLQLAQFFKSTKIEINQLLEEIKAKDKTVKLLRKDRLHHNSNGNNLQAMTKNHIKNSKPKMRKKEIESCNDNGTTMTTTSNNTNPILTNSTTTQTTQTTTCGYTNTLTMPHEMHERIMNVQNDLQYCKSKDSSGSDNDSALSSAPPSLSPQPGTQSNTSDVWQALLKESKDHENLQKEYDLIKEENQFLNCEITLAEEQIRELEKVIQMSRENSIKTNDQQLLERIHRLECKEAELLKELHELHEQNELLEFRIIELEEGNDKLSTNNRSFNTHETWTSTDDLNESPPAPSIHNKYDLNLLEPLPSDYVRESLLTMSTHSCFDGQEKLCLLQVLSLLHNLEAISQDQELSFDDANFNSISEKMNRFCTSTTSDAATTVAVSTMGKSSTPERVIATVQPFTCTKSISNFTVTATPSTPAATINVPGNYHVSAPKKIFDMLAMSMKESGIFDDEENVIATHQSSQTCPEDFSESTDASMLSSELCAEIQKLNKFRKKIEECIMNCNRRPLNDVGVTTMPMSGLDQSRLEYYKDRLELLENKVLIYESSGDVQLRRLAARLQKEIQLESMVKQLQQRVATLETRNRQLDEERCELEEIENDTRLHLQRMEVDFEMLSQRNIELEMSRDNARTNVDCLQQTIAETESQILASEAERDAWRQKFELITAFLPAILLYSSWKTQQQQPLPPSPSASQLPHHTTHVPYEIDDPSTRRGESGRCFCNQEHICPEADRFVELVQREQELSTKIADLNRAYNETLERADNLWAQMEKDYKTKLSRSQEDNQLLRTKIDQLEQRLENDAHYAQERIAQLEDEESVLKRRLAKLNKVNRDESENYKTLQDEFQALTTEYERLKSHVDDTLVEQLDKEKRKVRVKEDEVRVATQMYSELEQMHRNQMTALKSRLEKNSKDLLAMEVNNNELKSEVLALEHHIIELNQRIKDDDDKMNALMAENQSRHDSKPIKPARIKYNQRNLAQELGPFTRNSTNYNYTSVYALKSVASKISDSIKSFEVSREPISQQLD